MLIHVNKLGAERVNGKDQATTKNGLREGDPWIVIDFAMLLLPMLEDGRFSRGEVLKVREWLLAHREDCQRIDLLRYEWANWRDALADGQIEDWEEETLIETSGRIVKCGIGLLKTLYGSSDTPA